jgi:TolB protein
MKTVVRRVVHLWCSLGLVAAVIAAAPPATAAGPANGRIAFVDYLTGDIWTVAADGTDPVHVFGTRRMWAWGPSWSPDGTRLAFAVRDLRGVRGPRVITADPDGTDRVTVFDGRGGPSTTAWSPDGMTIAACVATGRTSRIVLAAADGSGAERVGPRDACSPAWSPDGARLAFVRSGDGFEELMTMAADGTDRMVLKRTRSIWSPTWSPDGSLIAYQISHRDDPTFDISLIAPDGTGKHPLVQSDVRHEGVPSWSPDGSLIVFERWPQQGAGDLFTVHPDGSGITRLTDTPDIDEWEPSWQAI